jgi:hypothetical protein
MATLTLTPSGLEQPAALTLKERGVEVMVNSE